MDIAAPSTNRPPNSVDAWIAAGFLAVLSLAASVLPAGPANQVPQAIHLMILVAFTVLAARRTLAARSRAWAAITVFGGCAAAAQILWMQAGVLAAGQGGGTVADALFLVGVAFGALGIGMVAFGRLGGARRWRSVSDGIVVASVAVFALWTFVFGPQLQGLPADRADVQYGRLAFVALDLIIVGVVGMAAINQRGRTLLWWVTAALTLNAVADGVLAWNSAQGGRAANPVSITAWTLAVFFLTLATLIPDRAATSAPAGAPRRRIVYASMVVTVVVIAAQIVMNRGLDLAALVLLFSIGVAVVANQHWVNQEISELSRASDQAMERLEHLANHDPLTGLMNRHHFNAHLEAVLGDAGVGPPHDGGRDGDGRDGDGTDGRRWAVAFLDLDRFKAINDSLGHRVGDQLLFELAQRLRRAVPQDCVVCRFGGDEFTLLFAPTHEHELERMIEDLRVAVAEPVELGGGERFHPTVSIGVTLARPNSTAERLISEADAAMYRAKERGRNRAEFYVSSSRRRARVALRLIDGMHRAMERDEFEVHYQPCVEVATGLTAGYEALLRWRHPDRGLLVPGQFLDVAEETGMIVEIGEWVLRTACSRTAALEVRPDTLPPVISVNLAAPQLAEPDLAAVVADALITSGLPADRLWLEVTETAIMTDPRLAGEILGDLRGLGLHLALDDFGTGYSSLTYLKRFPFETLKVDRSFVSGLGIDADDTAIVAGVIGLARSLGLFSIAEGVETPLQLSGLRDLGCDYAQGYLLGRPAPDIPAEVVDPLPRPEGARR